MQKKLKLCFDIDDTITKWHSGRVYKDFKAHNKMVQTINGLYEEGHHITLFTARGMTSCGPDKINELILPGLLENLESIGLKYHELITHKPSYDIIVDDKAIHPTDFLELVSGDKDVEEALKEKTIKHFKEN